MSRDFTRGCFVGAGLAFAVVGMMLGSLALVLMALVQLPLAAMDHAR